MSHGFDGTRTKLLIDTTLSPIADLGGPQMFCERFNAINARNNSKMAFTRYAIFWDTPEGRQFRAMESLQVCVFDQMTNQAYIRMEARTAMAYDYLTHPNLYVPYGKNKLDPMVEKTLA